MRVVFASRYDRMRRRVVDLLQQHSSLTIQETVESLGGLGVDEQDNPYAPERGVRIYSETLEQIRAWEEAPLLDELAVNAGYRATLMNLGLVSVEYDQLAGYVEREAKDISARLGVGPAQLTHICRCLLDDMRTRGALSRSLLRFHPLFPACPDFMRAAQWERRVKAPKGYAASDTGQPLAYRDAAEFADGVTSNNSWRKPGAGGRGPALERIFKHLLNGFGGIEPDADDLIELISLLRKPCQFVVDVELCGMQAYSHHVGESLWLALDTLRTHKFRSFLTILGVLIGTTTVIAVTSIMAGLDKQLVDVAEQFGTSSRARCRGQFRRQQPVVGRRDRQLADGQRADAWWGGRKGTIL